MGTQVDDAGTATGARAGTLTVIATMAAIAVVAVTGVVAWARLGQPAGSEAAPDVEAIPTALDGGNQPRPVPAAVVAAVDRPVVGAAKLDDLPGHMLDACMELTDVSWDTGSPTVEYAFITPDGVVASLTGTGDMPGGFSRGPGGEEPSGMRLRCDLDLEDGSAINRGGGSFEEIFPDGRGGGFLSTSCCDRDGLATASAAVAVPAGAQWALQDRGSWFLAYEVEGLEHVGVTWRYRERRMGQGGPPFSSVLFVAGDGTVAGEATAGGQF